MQAICELPGLDPLYVASEDKLVASASSGKADRLPEKMRQNKHGVDAAVIGHVVNDHTGMVVMKTDLVTSRIVRMPAGNLFPRTC